MRYLDRILGLPLLALDTAEEIGVTTHYVTDPVANRVVGFVVSKSNGLVEKGAYLFSEVVNFGEDVIILNSQNSVRPISQVSDVLRHLDNGQERNWRQALTSDGEAIGKLTEYTFDEGSAAVLSFWLAPRNGGTGVEVAAGALVSSSKSIVLLHRTGVPESNGSGEEPEVQPRGAEEEVYPEATRSPA